MDISVITVTHDSQRDIVDQMRSVAAGCQNISYEQIVVDNASVDGTRDAVHEFSHVRLVANEKNAGFGAANNVAATIAQGRYLLFLNPDMRVQPGSLGTLVGWMDAHPDAGIASCLLTDEGGMPCVDAMPRRFPTVWNILAIFFKLPHLFPHMLDRYLMRDMDVRREQGVDSVRGSFLFLRRQLYEQLGFAFDPRYFMWFEDVDVCREAKRLGWKVVYTPVISCADKVGRSFAQKNVWWKQWQFFRSAIQYFWKWRYGEVVGRIGRVSSVRKKDF